MSGRLTLLVLLLPLAAHAQLFPSGNRGPQPGNRLDERNQLIESLLVPPTQWESRVSPEALRLMNTPQNWNAATGVLMYSYQGIVIRNSNLTAQQMYATLRTFEQFSAGNVAEVRLVTAPPAPGQRTGRQWALFRARPEYPGLVGVLNGLQEFVNSRWVPVELFYDDRNMTIQAVTLGDHMIVGSRRWTVRPQADGSILVETEAWEARNGRANDIAMRTGVPPIMNGKDVMAMVWERYLQNLGSAFTQNGGTFSHAPGTNGPAGFWRERPEGAANPFQAGTTYYVPGERAPRRYPGTLPAPGSFGPPRPTATRSVPAGADVRMITRFSTIQCHQPACQSAGFDLSLSGVGSAAFAGFEGLGAQPGRHQQTRLTTEQVEALRQLLSAPPAQGAGMQRD